MRLGGSIPLHWNCLCFTVLSLKMATSSSGIRAMLSEVWNWQQMRHILISIFAYVARAAYVQVSFVAFAPQHLVALS